MPLGVIIKGVIFMSQKQINEILNKIELDQDNSQFKTMGWKPIVSVHPDAKILIIGQAPGLKTQNIGSVFHDQSGDRLRDWLGVTEAQFYDPTLFAILPMDFYFPGKGKSGDLPPRKNFATKWHPLLLEQMPHIKLTILIGSYAQNHYLKDRCERNLTETVRNFKAYLPQYFTIVHPSPLNRRWMAKNPWYETDVLPILKQSVKATLESDSPLVEVSSQ